MCRPTLLRIPTQAFPLHLHRQQLLNSWGLARSTTSPWWISDNNAGVSTLYDGTGAARALVVKIPGPNGTFPCTAPNTPANCFVSAPTGVVFNGSPDFDLSPGDPNTAAAFIFVTEDGTISAWAGGPAATLEVDNSTNPTPAEGAVYKGATIGEFKGKRYLYVTNFRSGKIEVYDTNFHQVTLSEAMATTHLMTNASPRASLPLTFRI